MLIGKEVGLRDLLIRIVKVLFRQGIPHVILWEGGVSGLRSRVEILLDLSPDHLKRLYPVLEASRLVPEDVDTEEVAQESYVFTAVQHRRRIVVDFVLSESSWYVEEVFRNAKVWVIGGAKMCFACPEDLIIHKLIWGIPRRLEDVSILFSKYPYLNKKYIAKWLKAFGHDTKFPE